MQTGQSNKYFMIHSAAMSTLEITILAVSLCMDSFALAISSGMVHRTHLLRHAFRLGACFALFQMAMPVIGWMVGIQLKTFIEGIDHWIAFGLLFAIGMKMMFDALRSCPEDHPSKKCSTRMLCGMALATSIDALVVGIGFAFIHIHIPSAIVIIGGMTFLFSFMGVVLGRKIGLFFGEIMTVIGGIVLVGIGCKILIEHLLAR